MSKTGIIGMSKPCFNCISYVNKSGVNIGSIYYTDANGDIIKTTLSKLYYDENRHYSHYSKKLREHNNLY